MAVNMKQYIISFQATLQGHKMVLTALKGMERQVKGVTATAKTGARATETYGAAMGKLAKRAMMVIPVWLVLRAGMMAVMRTFGDMVRAQLELEEGLARIRTVMQGTAQVIDAEMIAIKRQILDTSVKSRMSIKELAEAFYFLKTASLTAEEATSAFSATTDAMIGTGAKAKEMARAIAGIYNTMGKYILEGASAQEKFRKIADVLTYTYATQDVEMSELIAGYTKLAPYISGLSDSFTDLVTMIGFLNTRMLRAGRTGRLTARTILQITKNADKLRYIFGIVFDPKEPINLIGVITQINDKLKTTGKLTFEQQRALQVIFQTRGAISPRLLLESFDKLSESIKLAGENVDGFAQKMQQIRMATVTAQAARMRNIFAVLMNDFLSGVYSAKDFADTLKLLNETFISMRIPIQKIGQLIGWVATNFSQLALAVDEMAKIEFGASIWERFIPGASVFLKIGKLQETIKAMELKPVSWREYLAQQEKTAEIAGKEEKIREQIKTTEEEIKKLRLGTLKEEQERIKHNVSLMKIMGANTLDIVNYRLESLESLRGLLMEEDYELQLMQRQNEVLREQEKYRNNMVNVLEKAEISMLQAIGASELQILDIREKHLNAQRAIIGETQYMLKLGQLRTQQATALQQQKQKELQQATNLYMMYEKADMMERGRIRRLIELMSLTPEELAGRFRHDMYDQSVILKYWNNFSQQAQQAMGEAIRLMERLPQMRIPIPEMPEVAKKLLPHGEISEYWQIWIGQGRDAAGIVAGEFTKAIKKIPFGGILEGRRELPRPEIKPNFNVNINLPEDTLERMAELTGEQLTEKLKTDEALQKFLAQALRPYI